MSIIRVTYNSINHSKLLANLINPKPESAVTEEVFEFQNLSQSAWEDVMDGLEDFHFIKKVEVINETPAKASGQEDNQP